MHVWSEPIFCDCLTVKDLLSQNICDILRFTDFNETRTNNHLLRKRTANDLAKLENVSLQTKWLWVRVNSQ